MIDFSIQNGTCRKFLESVHADKSDYDPEFIRNYPYFNYLLQSGMPNGFEYGKFGVLLSIFLGMIKKLDSSLVGYFDTFFYQLLKEMDFTQDGLTIPGIEINELKSFLNTLFEISGNRDLYNLNGMINISLQKGANLKLNDLLGDIEMFLCHVIIRYNIEEIIRTRSILSTINKFEINKILFIKYFPRTLMLKKDIDIIPSDFLFSNPLRIYYYCRSILKANMDAEVERILELELKIFETKFFMVKGYIDSCDLEELKARVNNPEYNVPVKVNDTISILRNHNYKDVDLAYWTGSKPDIEEVDCDLMVYYDYISKKVRHQELTEEISKILSFFKSDTRKKFEYLKSRSDKLNAESQLNELFYKTILI